MFDQKIVDEALTHTSEPVIQQGDKSTTSGYRHGQAIPKKGQKALGMENSREGFWNVFGENVIAGSMDVAGSIAATFGNTQFASDMEAEVEMNLDFDDKEFKADTLSSFLGSSGDWLAQSLGRATPDIVGAVGAGVVTGGLGAPAVLGSGAFSFVRMAGSNYRMMRKWRPDADITEVRFHANILAAVQSGIEQLGGLEAMGSIKILNATGKKKAVTEIADELVKHAKRNGTMNAMQKMLVSSKNRASSMGKAAIAEFGEEQGQALAEIVSGKTFGEQEYTADDIFSMMVTEPARALPAGGVMGGVFHSSRANGQASRGMAKVTEKEKNAMFSKMDENGELVFDEEAMQKDDQFFDALSAELRPQFGRGADAAVDQIRSMAYVMSFASQVNYKSELLPADFIKDLSVGFVDSNSTQADINAIDSIRSDGTLNNTQKGEQILEYIAGQYGEDSSFYQTIKGVGDVVEASEIASSTDDLKTQMSRYAPTHSTERAAEWRSDLGEMLSSRLGAGGAHAITYDEMGDMFTKEDIARIFIEEPIVKVGDSEFAMKADQNGVSFVEVDEYNGEFESIVSLYVEDIQKYRDDAVTTGGQELLAREKALHAILESKYIVQDIVTTFENRQNKQDQQQDAIVQNRKLKESADHLEAQRQRIQSLTANDTEIDAEMSAEIKKADKHLAKQQEKLRRLSGEPAVKDAAKQQALDDADSYMDGLSENMQAFLADVPEASFAPTVEDNSTNESSQPITAQIERVNENKKSVEKRSDDLIADFKSIESELLAEDALDETETTPDDATPDPDVVTKSSIVAESDNGWGILKVDVDGSVKFRVRDENKRIQSTHDTFDEAAKIFGNNITVFKSPKVITKTRKSAKTRKIERTKERQAEIDQFREEMEPMIRTLEAARADGDTTATRQILFEIGRISREADIPLDDVVGEQVSTGALFEVDTVVPSTKSVGEMTDEEIQGEANKAGLIHNGFFEPMHWPVFIDPATNDSSFTVQDDQTISESLNSHRERTAKARAEDPTTHTMSGAGLFEQSYQTIRGMYIPTERTAIFFKGAGIQTVLHEFSHHAKSILPLEMQESLLATFNEQQGRHATGWTVEADEWFANTMTKWIVGKEQPFNANDKAKAGAFLLARRTIITAYKDFDLNEDTKSALDEMFGELPDQAAVFGAKQAMDSMAFQEPPTADMVSSLYAGRTGSRFESKEDTIGEPAINLDSSVRFDLAAVDVESNETFSPNERKSTMNHLHGLTGSHQDVKDLAAEVYGEDYGSLSSLTDEEIAVLAHIAEINALTGDSEVAAKAEKDSQQILEHTQAAGSKMESDRILTSDSRAVKLMKRMKTKLRAGGRAAVMSISSMSSIMKMLDDFSDTGVWHNMVSRPLNAAREMRMAVTKQNTEFFSGVIKKRGLNMRKIQRQKMDLLGFEYTKAEVAFMAVVNRMRPQDRDSFVQSNHADDTALGFKMIEEADRIVKDDTELTGFIDSIQDSYKNIYEDLSRTFKEVTGNDMGKLEWYMPFVRTNEWDDLDAVMSQLNHVDQKGGEFYKSSTSRMKERQGGAGAKIDISDPFGQTVRYINQASTYIAMAKAVKSVAATLNTDNTKAALQWKYGNGVGRKTNWKFMHGILNDLVMGELFHDARIKPMDEGEAVFRNWRTRYSMFALAGNIGTTVKQVLSLPLGLSRSGAPIETTMRAVGEILAIAPRAFANGLTNATRFLSGRGATEGYKHILTGTRVYDLWSNHSQVLLNRHGNPETGEAQSYNFGGMMGIEISGIPLGEALMAGISSIDAITVGTLWGATYDSWVRLNKANGMLESDAIADAAEKANDMIRDTQPPSLPQDRNLLQRGNEYIRSFFMFTGATMRQYEVFATDIVGRSHSTLSKVKSSGVGELSSVLFKGNDLQSGLAVQLGLGFVLPAIVAGVLSRRREPTERELMYDIMSYPITALPFMKGLTGAMVGLETNGGEASTYIERAGIEVFDGIESACKAFYGEGWTGDNISEAMDGLAFMLHSPKVMSRIAAASLIKATGEDDFLDTLKAQYVDPYDETKEF